jgi:hypothetical protein
MMNDIPPSPNGEFLFELLNYYTSLLDNPEHTASLTDEERHLLHISASGYRANANFLAKNIIEPVRVDNLSLGDEAYAAVNHLVTATAFIHSILVHSESLKMTLRSMVEKDKNIESAAHARKMRAAKPEILARQKIVADAMGGYKAVQPFGHAAMILGRVNKELAKMGFGPISKKSLGRLIDKNNSTLP